MHYITSFHYTIVGKNKTSLGKNSDFSLLTFLYKSRMFCEKIRRRTMKSCDETYTSVADEYEERAEDPYSSCYDGMLKQMELLGRARKHQEEARKIQKIFNGIAEEGNSVPSDDEMLKKGVLIVSRGKALFSTDQLVQVCEHMFEELPFVAFKGSADACPYVVVIFSPNCQYGDVCKVKSRLEIFKKEAAVDNFLIRFKMESIFLPEKYFQHLQDRSSIFIIRNENCGISKELAALVKTLKEMKHTAGKKKRSSSLPRSTELYQKKRKPSPLNIKQ